MDSCAQHPKAQGEKLRTQEMQGQYVKQLMHRNAHRKSPQQPQGQQKQQ
jgi:hypothetical protein